MTSLSNYTTEQRHGFSSTLGHEKYCDQYLLVSLEAALGDGVRAFLYFMGLAYCFIGLSAITARFFLSMENVVKHTRTVVEMDPCTNKEIVRSEKVWNYTIADITLLAFGTSFPQICLATIDAILNIGNLYAGGLGPGTLVGSAAFDLFPIHAVCVVVPKAGELKRIEDIGVWLVELFWSFWAYIWLYIILEVSTSEVVTLWESILTVLQFGLLLLHAYAQDKRWPSSIERCSHNILGALQQKDLFCKMSYPLDLEESTFGFSHVGKCRIQKIEQYIPMACKNFMAVPSRTMEASCIRTSLSHCPWMDCFHLLFDLHQWNSLCCNEAHRSDKLYHRNKSCCAAPF